MCACAHVCMYVCVCVCVCVCQDGYCYPCRWLRDSHTTRVCQATLRPGSVLAGPQQAEEGHGSPTAEGRTRERSPTVPCRKRARSNMSASTGRRLMSPLRPYPARSPAENLQLSRVKLRPINAHRAGRKRSPVWHLGSWNVRSLVDCEGPVDQGGLAVHHCRPPVPN